MVVLEDASGDAEMCTVASAVFVDIGREVGEPEVILPSVDTGGVLVSMVLPVAKGSVAKLVNGYVGIVSEVKNVDFDTFTIEDVGAGEALDPIVRGEPEGRLDNIQVSIGEVAALETVGGLDRRVVPGVTNVDFFSNGCLMSAKVVERTLEDIDDERLSEGPKEGRISGVGNDDVAITPLETRPV
jgi:hypothetical protein